MRLAIVGRVALMAVLITTLLLLAATTMDFVYARF